MGQDEQEKLAAEWEAQLAAEEEKGEATAQAQPQSQPQSSPAQSKPQPQARPAEFSPLKERAPVDSPNHLEFILDIPLQISVQLGNTRMMIRDLLQLGQGSVIELDKMAGEPMDILVNDRLIARGEVVVVNEKFGIRLTDVLSPADRVQQLK